MAALTGDKSIAFLYSGGAQGVRSRYSYLCLDPVSTVRQTGTRVAWNGTPQPRDLFDVLRAALAAHAPEAVTPAPVPFAGGAVGFIGYDAAAARDIAATPPSAFASVPEAQFAIYDLLYAWDHQARRAWLIAPHAAKSRAQAALARWQSAAPAEVLFQPLRWRAVVSQAQHMHRVARAQAYIRAGDIYQANITAPFAARRPAGLAAARIFAQLAQANPAPFSAFIACGDDCGVASVSPERFISLSPTGALETRPIKGTRRRGETPAADEAAKAWLRASAKDHAENLMIVDLMRNDLSRVAVPGTVRVPALCALESFPSVHHLVSSVTAQLRPGLDAIDVLRAALPGGSITGAPKIRAMEIIAELEAAARGPYCGTAAWLGFDGAMDSNILIRTVTVTGGQVVAQAGGGIVAESDPAEEWDEAMAKISPLLHALGSV